MFIIIVHANDNLAGSDLDCAAIAEDGNRLDGCDEPRPALVLWRSGFGVARGHTVLQCSVRRAKGKGKAVEMEVLYAPERRDLVEMEGLDEHVCRRL